MADQERRGASRTPVWAWPLLVVDLVIHAAEHMRPVGGARGTFFLAVHQYRGRPITLSDGTQVKPGDTIGEIHIWNAHLPAYRTAGARGALWRIMEDFSRDMRTLAAEVTAGRVPDNVHAFLGVTPLARIGRRVGFTVRDLPRGPWRSFLTLYQGMLRHSFRPVGDSRLPAVSAECWISRTDVLRLYGPGAETAAAGAGAGGSDHGQPAGAADGAGAAGAGRRARAGSAAVAGGAGDRSATNGRPRAPGTPSGRDPAARRKGTAPPQ